MPNISERSGRAENARESPVRFGYADPPYPGMSHLYKDHPDYGGEVDHEKLVQRLCDEFPAGWVLHTASSTLASVLAACPEDVRVMAWVKPFASWKKGVYPAYAWEPVIMWGGRNVYGDRQTVPDFCSEGITLKRGLTGAKPERVCHWLFDCLGATPDDEMVDLFPGSGAVSRAWRSYCDQPRLAFPVTDMTEPMFEDVA